MDTESLRAAVTREWDEQAVPNLAELIRIPAVTTAYDRSWADNGHLRAAAEHVKRWVEGRGLPNVRCEVLELDGRPPLLVVEAQPTAEGVDLGTVLLYGHLDRQPPTGEWSPGRDAWTPVLDGDRLYGRGSVDDSYSAYVAISAIVALAAAGGVHARSIVLLETEEESASGSLPAYLDLLQNRLKDVSLVICLDSGGEDHKRLWLTKSLRGLVSATLTVQVLDTPVHSGLAAGIVPDSFRIVRQLLERLEDATTGEIRLPEMNAPIPGHRRAEVAALTGLPDRQQPRYPLTAGTRQMSDEAVELILNNTWRPSLTVTAAAGLPEPAAAVPVVRQATSVRLSFRLPPTVKADHAARALIDVLTTDVPYSAKVDVTDVMLINGWNARPTASWLTAALETAEQEVFDGPSAAIGLGGGIPFLEMLGNRYPEAQFVVTGAVRSDSNVHAPDEWLSLSFAHKLTEAIALLMDSHARRNTETSRRSA
ncbi:M20/M25/M40 family metallo-hydrolase [Actinoplanes sp. NPDC049596]|uniref:M20/M25/M40 family metallo-hydrolase n=1 Tax=unclassified Actinoplanes TaxID=2626549 RepID=UPI00343DC15A